MEKYKSENLPQEKIEKEIHEKLEYGKNVVLDIDLIRHPEKDYETGNVTEKGKYDFFEKLRKEYNPEFDTYKFYLSPHKRPQQLKETIQDFLNEKGLSTTIRNKEELLGRITEFTPEAQQALVNELEKRHLLGEEDLRIIQEKSQKIPAYEPAIEKLEKRGNQLLIEKFFDKNFPESNLIGKDIGQEIERLVERLEKLASRLKSDSKVKIILVGHSGIIEYFTKLVYLKNHPELKAEDVDLEKIGGLLKPLEGPKIVIKSDEAGKQTINLSFKDLINLNA